MSRDEISISRRSFSFLSRRDILIFSGFERGATKPVLLLARGALFFDSFDHDVDSFDDVLIKLLAKIAITNSITPTLN
jgi:hypothetical protein